MCELGYDKPAQHRRIIASMVTSKAVSAAASAGLDMEHKPRHEVSSPPAFLVFHLTYQCQAPALNLRCTAAKRTWMPM